MKHKVGDNIRITANTSNHGLSIGSIVTIQEISSNRFMGSFYIYDGWAIQEDECELYIDPNKYQAINAVLNDKFRVEYLGNKSYRITCNEYDRVFANATQEDIDSKIREILEILGSKSK